MHAPVFSTRLTKLFGMRHPIIVGGMMFHSRAPFIAACARAGVMSFMTPKSYGTPETFQEGLAEALDLADGNPFGVNFSISRFRSNELNDVCLKIAQDAGITRYETAGSHPGEMVEKIHQRGGILIHKSTQLRHAIKAAQSGVDAVSILGMEAGGHPGVNPHPSHVLLSNSFGKIDVPIALGGAIGTGRQLLGALAQGADAALLATRFLPSTEIAAHENYKHRMVASGMDDSVTALQSIRDTWRVLNNETAREVQRIEFEKHGTAKHADFGELVKGEYSRDHAYIEGDTEKGMISCSASISHANAVVPVEETVDQIIGEAVSALEALHATQL